MEKQIPLQDAEKTKEKIPQQVFSLWKKPLFFHSFILYYLRMNLSIKNK